MRFFSSDNDLTELTPEAIAEMERVSEIADFVNMNRIRDRADEMVEDAETAEALKPYYRQFCKRPCFHDEYLPTFNRPNVTLVDVSDAQGVERITRDGVVANGEEYKVDCIVYATGFEISTSYKKRFRYEINGENGTSIYDHWADGRKTLHGHSTHGFPNWFIVGATQSGVSANYSSMVDEQAKHIAFIMNEADSRGAQSVQPTSEAEEEWVQIIKESANATSSFFDACTPGYYNNEGQHRQSPAAFLDQYTPGVNVFNRLLQEWRNEGNLRGLEFG